MIQSRPYEFLVQFTPQREWVERRGILMLLAMFFIELGAGTFVVSSIFGNSLGMLVGWLLCGVLGGSLHLIFLGHPSRFWRMVFSSGWKSSWISRGLIFVSFFLVLGLIHMILLQMEAPVSGVLIASDIFAFMVIIYVGFVMSHVNAIPLWNTPLLPVLYFILGIWGGLGLTIIAMNATESTTKVGNLNPEQWSEIFLIAFIFFVFVYLFGIRYQGATGQASVREIVTGKLAPLFWVVVGIFGTLLPVGIAVITLLVGSSIPAVLLVALIVFELLGDLTLRYCLLKAGLYGPLIPSKSYA